MKKDSFGEKKRMQYYDKERKKGKKREIKTNELLLLVIRDSFGLYFHFVACVLHKNEHCQMIIGSRDCVCYSLVCIQTLAALPIEENLYKVIATSLDADNSYATESWWSQIHGILLAPPITISIYHSKYNIYL